MFAVMGASGNTGGQISNQLLQQGEKIRAIGRSSQRLAGLEKKGAELCTGDARDATFLTSAFRDTAAVYILLPPDPQSPDLRKQWDEEGEAIVKAIRNSGVRYAVFLSSIGADLPEGTGPIAGLHAQEERLRKLPDVNSFILRPAWFFENFYAVLTLIRHHGINGGAVAPDLRVPMIGTRDIAEVAARALKARHWTGIVVRELLGARDLTFAEATRIIGARIGKPDLKYVQFPYADFASSLVQMGMSANMAGLYAEMARAFNEGKIKSREGRTPENTTQTRFEDFADDLARAYEAA
jgi:uncharacterized protein YbjT (DUF2867 family)